MGAPNADTLMVTILIVTSPNTTHIFSSLYLWIFLVGTKEKPKSDLNVKISKGAVYLCTDCFGRDLRIKATMGVLITIATTIIFITTIIILNSDHFTTNYSGWLPLLLGQRPTVPDNESPSGSKQNLSTGDKIVISQLVTTPAELKWKFGWFQMGEGFGSAVAACDLNGDGADDLIVGSPMYRCTNTNNTNTTPITPISPISSISLTSPMYRCTKPISPIPHQ